MEMAKKISGWLLFIGSLVLFYFNFWVGLLVHNLMMCVLTFTYYKRDIFNPKHSIVKIILPPLIFGFFGIMGSVMAFGSDNKKSPSSQKKILSRFIHNYDYALKGGNGLFNIQDDVIKKHNLIRIESDDLMIPLLRRFNDGEIEFYEQTTIEADEGLFRFQYDVSLFNPEDEFQNEILFGFNTPYESEGLFRLTNEYVKTHFENLSLEMQKNYDDSELNYETFYERFIEEYIDGGQWSVPSIKDYLTTVNSFFNESHIKVWVSPHFERAYSPQKAMFPVDIIEHGFVKSCGFDLYYKEV